MSSNRFGLGYQVPLGMVLIGGPLIDAGHLVKLIDNDVHGWSPTRLGHEAKAFAPDCILVGHTGATAAHPAALETAAALRAAIPGARIAYGGVYPTYAAEVTAPRSTSSCAARGSRRRSTWSGRSRRGPPYRPSKGSRTGMHEARCDGPPRGRPSTTSTPIARGGTRRRRSTESTTTGTIAPSGSSRAPPRSSDLVEALVGSARARTRAGKAATSIPLLERALGLMTKTDRTGSEGQRLTADAEFALAEALWESGSRSSRVGDLASSALATERSTNHADVAREIEKWMEARALAPGGGRAHPP